MRRVLALTFISLVALRTAGSGGAADLRHPGIRLGPRGRNGAVRRKGFARAGLDVRSDPRPLLPRDGARARLRPSASACSCERGSERRDRVGSRVHGSRRGRRTPLPAGSYVLGADLTLQVGGETQTLVPPIRFLPGKRPLELDRPYRGAVVVSLQNGRLAVSQRREPRAVREGRRRRRDGAAWEPAGASGAGRRCSLLRPCQPANVVVLRRLRGYPQPGLRRSRGGGFADQRGVEATKGTVVLFEGKVAWTFFSASSGGKTAAIEDGFNGVEPLPT